MSTIDDLEYANNKYQQTLQEIREIAELGEPDEDRSYSIEEIVQRINTRTKKLNKIQAKINEVIGAEE